MQPRAWQRPLRFVEAQHGWHLQLKASAVAKRRPHLLPPPPPLPPPPTRSSPAPPRRRPGSMGKGGTRFVGDAVGVRGKSKGYTSKDQKKVRR